MLAAALTAVTLVLASSASADELYLCDGGRLVKVEVDTIEALKRTDPCIARYFGLTIAAAAAPAGTARAAVEETGALPDGGASTATGEPAATGRALSPTSRAVRTVWRSERAKPAAPRTERVDVPGEGYRTVAIINAGPDEARVYRHER